MAIRFKGVRDLARSMALLAPSTTKVAQRALLSVGEEIMEDAKSHYVPVDSGNLASSGRVDPSPSGETVTLSFGKDAAHDYALAVHEHPSTSSPPSWRGKQISFKRGGPKYLERPLNAAKSSMSRRVARKVKSEIGWFR